MPKNIVICSDGTGNSDVKGRGTNVFKLFEAVDLNGHLDDPTRKEQIAFYDDGVGTESIKPLRILGGAIGIGLSRNVQQLYASLVRAYEPGDNIYVFGFSRGAFTVRTLAGMIDTCGILQRQQFGSDAELRAAVGKAYGHHRKKFRTIWGDLMMRGKTIEPLPYRTNADPEITFMGVWDTVDAVGVPWDGLAKAINYFVYCFKFPQKKLSKLVKKACHALAVDEQRQAFHPVLWNESEEAAPAAGAEPRIEQVWFAGVHSNVGGGYPKQGMSLVALDWIMNKAADRNLRFIASERKRLADLRSAADKLYNSRAGAAVYYQYKPRVIGEICAKSGVRPTFHSSVFERIQQGVEGYAPGNIPANFAMAGPASTRAEEVAKNLRIHMPPGTACPLEDVSFWRNIREWSHAALLSATVGAVIYSLPGGPAQSLIRKLMSLGSGDGLSSLSIFTGNLAGLTEHWQVLVPPSVLIGCFLVGSLARRRMELVFSEFWHNVLEKPGSPPPASPRRKKRSGAAAGKP